MITLKNSFDLDFHYSQWAGLLNQLAPVIFGRKPASAINRVCANSGEPVWFPEGSITAFSPECTTRVFNLRSTAERVLVFFYQPVRLMEILSQPDNRRLLTGFGYQSDCNIGPDLDFFQERLYNSLGFPHEIGVFLGIPAHDVAGFIENKGKNYLLNGYWKVYYEPDQARMAFNEFNQAKQKMTEFIIRQHELKL